MKNRKMRNILEAYFLFLFFCLREILSREQIDVNSKPQLTYFSSSFNNFNKTVCESCFVVCLSIERRIKGKH